MDTCENELQFLGECPAYKEERTHLIIIMEAKERIAKYEIKMQGTEASRR